MTPAPRLLRPLELDPNRRHWTGRYRADHVWRVLNLARDGDEARLKKLLAADAALANADYWYATPLHFAVREGHAPAARLLIEAGADVFHRVLYDQLPLLTAAEDRGHTEVADLLRAELARRASSDGARAPIHEAVASGDVDAVERLLANDPDAAERGDHLGRRPLHYAVESGQRALVDLLLAHGADVDAPGFSSDDRLGGYGFRPVALALWHHPYWRQRNDFDMARHLLAKGARYSITIAAALGDADRVAELLRTDRALANDQEPGGKRPLSAAAERGHLAIVERLLRSGADPNLPEGPNCPGGFALWAASRSGHLALAERLLDAGADPNAEVESSGTPIGATEDAEMRALLYCHGGQVSLGQHVHDGNIDVVAALLDADYEMFDPINAVECFTLATSAGHEHIVRLLLARGVRLPEVVTYCQTYLWRSLPLARLLLEHGMHPSLPNWQQVTPLHHMAAKGDIDAARLFLEFGADPEAVDEEYRSTPLGWAARSDQTEFVRFALAQGFEPTPADSPDWAQPVAWAQRRGHAESAALLRAAAQE